MKIFLFFSGLIFALVLPTAALANCQWADISNCTDLGSGWGLGIPETNCDQGWKRGSQKCCCGPNGGTIGCCLITKTVGGGPGLHSEYSGQLTNRQKCQDLGGTYLAGWIVNKAESDYREDVCRTDKGVCRWYLDTSCSNINLVLAVNQTWCRASEKPSGVSAVCCCGASVKQTAADDKKDQDSEGIKEAKLDLPNPTNPLGTVNPSEVIGRVIKALLAIIGSIFLLLVVYGGFTWMTAAGNDAKVEKGRNTVMWAVAGLVVIFLAWMLTGFVLEALGV